MLELVTQLTPPRKGKAQAAMSPTSFLVASETISPLRRKTPLPSITTNQAKRFRLDPAPIAEDKTILQYHQRVSQALPEDRPKLQIAIPFEKTWPDVLNSLKVCHIIF
jgi:hypothetical protein